MKRRMLLSAAALMGVGCVLATTGLPCSAQDYLDLPQGVIHVALPPGEVKMENTVKNGKPLLRLRAGSASAEAERIFLGDGKNAVEFEATKDGIYRTYPNGKNGSRVGGEVTWEPVSIFGVAGGDFLTVDQLKPGSVYVTTPSIKFSFQPPISGAEGEVGYAKVELKGRFSLVKLPGAIGPRFHVGYDEYELDLKDQKELQGEDLKKLEGEIVLVTGLLTIHPPGFSHGLPLVRVTSLKVAKQ